MSAEGGFTLAELIVATTMISIVMAGVYTAMHTAVNVWRYGETDYDRYDDARYALGLFTREMQAVPGGTYPWFIGTDDEVEFFTMSQPMDVEEGTAQRALRVSYRLSGQSGKEGRQFVREEQIVESGLPYSVDCEDARRSGRTKLARKHEITLATNVKDLKIQYHWAPPSPPRNPAEPPPWLDMIIEDQNKKCWGLPQGISIELEMNGMSSESEPKTFTQYIAFRGSTSPLPRDLYDAFVGRR